jgi:hypothetical protein
MWQARKEAGACHVFAGPTLLRPFMRLWPHLQHGSLCESQPQKFWHRLRQHGEYFESIYACIRTRSMTSSLWQLCAVKRGQGLRRNSAVTCSRTLTLWVTFGFKSVWLLPLGLSEEQSVLQCTLKCARTEGEDEGKLCTGHKRNARPCSTELCIMSSSVSRVPRGSHRACHPQRYPYVKF